jgi:hypothetical protein
MTTTPATFPLDIVDHNAQPNDAKWWRSKKSSTDRVMLEGDQSLEIKAPRHPGDADRYYVNVQAKGVGNNTVYMGEGLELVSILDDPDRNSFYKTATFKIEGTNKTVTVQLHGIEHVVADGQTYDIVDIVDNGFLKPDGGQIQPRGRHK